MFNVLKGGLNSEPCEESGPEQLCAVGLSGHRAYDILSWLPTRDYDATRRRQCGTAFDN
eukprot:COSAG02_NODE_6718_length_3403_cov_1.836562_7_plen_59_part_00